MKLFLYDNFEAIDKIEDGRRRAIKAVTVDRYPVFFKGGQYNLAPHFPGIGYRVEGVMIPDDGFFAMNYIIDHTGRDIFHINANVRGVGIKSVCIPGCYSDLVGISKYYRRTKDYERYLQSL